MKNKKIWHGCCLTMSIIYQPTVNTRKTYQPPQIVVDLVSLEDQFAATSHHYPVKPKNYLGIIILICLSTIVYVLW